VETFRCYLDVVLNFFFYFSIESGSEEIYLHVASSITFSLITGLEFMFFVFVCVFCVCHMSYGYVRYGFLTSYLYHME
jgi:hypothetical protein